MCSWSDYLFEPANISVGLLFADLGMNTPAPLLCRQEYINNPFSSNVAIKIMHVLCLNIRKKIRNTSSNVVAVYKTSRESLKCGVVWFGARFMSWIYHESYYNLSLPGGGGRGGGGRISYFTNSGPYQILQVTHNPECLTQHVVVFVPNYPFASLSFWKETFFFQKTGFDISCKLFPIEAICIRCQIMLSAELAQILLKGNNGSKVRSFFQL